MKISLAAGVAGPHPSGLTVMLVDGKIIRVKDTALWSPNLRAAVAEMSDGRDGVGIKFHSKTQAIETLARHLAMFKDNVDLHVNVSLSDLVNGSYRLERGELQVVDGKLIEVKSAQSAPNKSEQLLPAPDQPENSHKPDSDGKPGER